jgi:hypothetical protein
MPVMPLEGLCWRDWARMASIASALVSTARLA